MVLSEIKKIAIIMVNKEYGFNKTVMRIGEDVLKGDLSEEDFEKYFINEGIVDKSKFLSCPMRVKMYVENQSRYSMGGL